MRAEDRPADHVRFATGLGAANQCIARIGARTGTFARQGLNVTFPKLEVGGPESVAGLLRGDWDFAQTGSVPVVEAVLNGGDAVILLRDSVRPDSIVIMTSVATTRLGQLNGKQVGVLTDAYSGQTGIIARLTLEQAGAAATYIGLGTYRRIFAALAAGDIDAGALPVDFQFLEQTRQRFNCFEARSLRVPAVLATTRRLIATNRELVLRAARGFVDAIHMFKKQRHVVVPLLQEFLDLDDADAVERLYQYYATGLPAIPRPDLSDAMPDLCNLFRERYAAGPALLQGDIVDTSFADELQEGELVARV